MAPPKLVSPSYESSDDEEIAVPSKEIAGPCTILARQVETAPLVLGVSSREKAQDFGQYAESSIMKRNLPAAAVLAPRYGPDHPYRKNESKSTAAFIGGSIERAVVEEWGFDEEYYSYQSRGVAMAASGGQGLVGNERKTHTGRRKRERILPRDYGDEETDGIWAPVEKESLARQEAIFSKEVAPKKTRVNDDNEFLDRRDERKISHLLPPRHTTETQAIEAKSEFHGDQEYDYRGRSWFEAPPGLKSKIDDNHDCFLPKKCLHTFTGHTKGVQTIRIFPKTGHLLLSASLDGTCKIWDIYQSKKVQRTYAGHAEAARDINFNYDGTKFASTGFDRFIRVWNTETGACLNTLSPHRKMCYCVLFYPRDDNIILAGASDNKIYQWDLRLPAQDANGPQIIQEYNYHLKPVNSILYIDNDDRFISTGDDKKIFVWEHNIPVPIKYISEPGMQAVPSVALHPSTQYWCGQSLDNSVITFQARDKVKQLHKKKFRGHLCSGYACGLSFSPNGRFLTSGDAEGRLFIWDFKTTRLVRKTHCHDAGPCISTAWHPIEPSWIFTAGWDSLIRLWG